MFSQAIASSPGPSQHSVARYLQSWAGPVLRKCFSEEHIRDYPFDVQTRLKFRLFVHYGDSDCHLGSSFGGLCPYPDRQVCIYVRIFACRNVVDNMQPYKICLYHVYNTGLNYDA